VRPASLVMPVNQSTSNDTGTSLNQSVRQSQSVASDARVFAKHIVTRLVPSVAGPLPHWS